MSQDLRDQLQRSLGSAYTIERELGGGGMSRVFVALETAIDRQVVIKVLPAELAAGVNVDRFRREIQLAGRLQHPHIVPIHAAGVADGLPYYTMPMVEGESLRARLARTGELSVPDTIRFLREVLDALAYAHAHGVVHRDIKPDNILISGQHAVVTDFGVAKAISEAAGSGSSLTSLGVALGTPAYMAPEQAAADPNTDARADLYAVGAMAYEMLTGQPPFAGRSPQMTLAAHLGETPEPVAKRRPNVPPVLAALVMRLLEKRPADRPQKAEEVLNSLDALMTPVTGTSPAMPAARPGVSTARAVAIYVGATLLVVALAWVAALVIGLPMWIVPGALVVMALGAPVIALSAVAQSTPTPVPTPTGGSIPTAARIVAAARPYLTWRRVALGGVASMTLFLAFVGGYMLLRSLGLGSAGSLLAAGLLKDRDKVLVADFRAPVGDSAIGSVVSDALRTDLQQTRVVSVVTPSDVRAALARMRKPAGSTVDLALAREIAAREGIKAVVDGDIAQLGSGFIASARLVSAPTGDVLAAFRETANDANSLIPAVDRLSRALRAKIGESLRSVNGAPALAQVSTVSLEALRKYSEGARAYDFERDFQKAATLLLAAIALDSNFAMAYRKLAVVYNATGSSRDADVTAMLTKAFNLRERLPELERHLTAGAYYSMGAIYDRPKAIAAYEAALSVDPRNGSALNNIAIMYGDARDHARAADMYARSIASDSGFNGAYSNLAAERFDLGDTTGAFAALRVLERRAPSTPDVFGGRLWLYAATHQYDSARAQAEHMERPGANKVSLLTAADMGSDLATVQGKMRLASDLEARQAALSADDGDSLVALDVSIHHAQRLSFFLQRPQDAVRLLDEGAKRFNLAARPPLERRYLTRAAAYAQAGEPARARALLADWEGKVPPEQRGRAFFVLMTRGTVELADGHTDSAIAYYRRANESWCEICGLYELARAYDVAGMPDSTIAIAERTLATNENFRLVTDNFWLASTYKRLGELYEARGNTEKALSYYGKFVAVWKDADPELQGQLSAVKQRMAELAKRKG